MNRRHRTTPLRHLIVVMFLLLGACAQSDDGATGGDDKKAVEDTVREAFKAEEEKDTDAFLALWTDKGLEELDYGSREEIESGEGGVGEDPLEPVRFSKTEVDGDKASTQVDATATKAEVAKGLFRMNYSLIKEDDDWLIDGFEFVGSPPPESGTEVLDIKAVDYAFNLDKSEIPGEVAFKFSNEGKEQHELTFFKGPDGVDVATAKAALENVDGGELTNLPSGYKVDHLSFAEPGMSMNVAFAEPLEPGTYVFACYIPEGGFGEQGPINPQGKPHIQLGMINTITVK